MTYINLFAIAPLNLYCSTQLNKKFETMEDYIFDGIELRVVLTPGHSPGGVSFIFSDLLSLVMR